MTLPTLYSLTSKNQTQVWRIETDQNRFRTVEGIKGGAMTESAWTTCNGKNLGKANETTPEDQAEKEAKAKWQKKLDSGYWENEADIHKNKFFEPMLAKKWEDYPETNFPLIAQVKYDGLRCVINKDGIFSRNGKRYVSVPHIWEIVKHIVEDGKIVLDGELYNHDLKNDFNKIVSLVKQSKPTSEDLAESAKLVKFYVYDCFFTDNPKASYENRHAYLRIATSPRGHNYDERFVITKSDTVYTREQALEKFAEYIADGYEGMMLRVPNSPYENKRSKYLLKYKEFCDEEFEILDVIEGKGGREGKMGRILFKMKDGKTFESNARGNDAFYTQLLLDRDAVRGTTATVRYQNLTPDGIPRFPVCVALRTYE